MRNKGFQEDRGKDCQEIEELQKISRQSKIDELSMQHKEHPSTVIQLAVQIQDLQDKVNA